MVLAYSEYTLATRAGRVMAVALARRGFVRTKMSINQVDYVCSCSRTTMRHAAVAHRSATSCISTSGSERADGDSREHHDRRK